jgi:type I restriction enzyme M protein
MAKTKKEKTAEEKPFEQMLWAAADKMRKNIDAAEYKHYVLGLLFLKYVSDAFEELHSKIVNKEGDYAYDDPEDKLVYSSEYVFFVPVNARWSYLVSRAKLPTIGEDIDTAMDLIEKDNPKLRGVLPKQFALSSLTILILAVEASTPAISAIPAIILILLISILIQIILGIKKAKIKDELNLIQ